MGLSACVYAVNRRVGGLEMYAPVVSIKFRVNRRVGGLESEQKGNC